jgi:arylamine N-acetyltransferase
MNNRWPMSDTQTPVYIVERANQWGWHGRCDQPGFEVFNAGRQHGLYTSMEVADLEACRLYERWWSTTHPDSSLAPSRLPKG